MSQTFRLLTGDDVRRMLEGVDLIRLMEDALLAFSARAVVQPIRTAVFVGPERSVLGLMPAHLPAQAALGSKLVTVFNANHALGLPSHFATVLLFDDRTGALTSVMDGSYITEMRTPAVSAVAVRHLARKPVRTLALVGCGVQARSHLETITADVETIEEVRVWSPADDLPAFAEAMRGRVRARVIEAESCEDAARRADLVVLVTSSPEPVLRREWVRPGSLVISVGACRRDHREMDPELVAASRVFVDSREAALVESGDIVQGIAEGRFDASHLCGELGEVMMGRIEPRSSETDIVVFKSLGLAVEDVAVADLVRRRAVIEGQGIDLTL
jgi:alanine dehydrogenase